MANNTHTPQYDANTSGSYNTNPYQIFAQMSPSETGNGPYQHPEARLSQVLFFEYRSRRMDWAINSVDDRDFKDGAQWTPTQKKELKRNKQAPVVVNVLYPAIEQAKGALTANQPRFNAVAREGGNSKLAAALSDIMSFIWYKSEGNKQLKTSVEDYYTTGMGALLAYYDPKLEYGRGEIRIRNIDPIDVYIDPNSKDHFCRDAAHIIIMKVMTREQIERIYPQYKEILDTAQRIQADVWRTVGQTEGDEGQGTQNQPLDYWHQKFEVLDRFTKIPVKKYVITSDHWDVDRVFEKKEYDEFLKTPCVLELTENTEPRYITKEDELVFSLALAEKMGGVFHYAISPEDPSGKPMPVPGQADPQVDAKIGLQTIPNSTVHLIVQTMKQAVEAKALAVRVRDELAVKRVLMFGGIVAFNEIIDTTEYPIVLFKHGITRHPYPTSPVRIVRPLQVFVNKLRSLILAHTANATNVKFILPRGSGNPDEIRQEAQRAGSGVIFYDAELGAPTIAGPVPLPNELYKNESDMRHDIQEILGVYTVSQGDPNQQPDTYRGTVALDEYGQRRIKSYKDDIEMAIDQLGRIVFELIQKHYTEERAFRITKPYSEPFDVTINKDLYDDTSKALIGRLNDVTVGKYDIQIVSGSTLPVNRWARAEYYLQLYKDGIIDRAEVLKQTDLVDVEGVMKRMSEIEQLRGALTQAQDQIKQLSGDLQTAERESVHDRKRVEIEKFKSQLADSRSRMDAAASVFTARLKDELNQTSVAVASQGVPNRQKGKKNARK